MKDYYQFQINNSKQNRTSSKSEDLEKDLQTNSNFYSNEKFLDSVFNSNCSDMIIYCYQYDFMKVINIIEEIFKSLLGNLPLLPYSIKCLCRIISVLIKKNFMACPTQKKILLLQNFSFVNYLHLFLRIQPPLH